MVTKPFLDWDIDSDSHSGMAFLPMCRTEADVCAPGCIEASIFRAMRTDCAAIPHPARRIWWDGKTYVFTVAWDFPGMAAVLWARSREGVAAGIADEEIKPKLEVCRGVGEIVAAKMSSARTMPLAPRLQCPIAEATRYSTDASGHCIRVAMSYKHHAM